MREQNEGIDIPEEVVQMVLETPRLFPEVVIAMAGRDIESMRLIRDALVHEVSRSKLHTKLEGMSQLSAEAPVSESPWVM